MGESERDAAVSLYGRLWEEASTVRRRIVEALIPAALPSKWTTADAKRIAREEATKFISRVDRLADELAAIECEMAKEPE